MKKNIYKILILGLLFCIAILAVTGCRNRGNDPISDGGDSTVVQPAEQYVELNENQITLDLYNDYTLQCNVVGISDDVVWSSSDSAIASVENGKVIALSVGDAQITATAGGFTAKCSVTVENKGVVPAMQNYTRDFEIRRTNTYDVNPTILFAGMEKDISDAQLAFEVADSTVATIDANGIATALKEGTTAFTVSGSFRGITMLPITGTIVVKKNIVIAMNSLNVNIYACDPDGTYETQFQLESAVYVEASLISGAKLDWSSEDEKIVTVENGLITAHRAGTAMINAAYTTNDGDVINAGVVVNVERPVIRLDSLYEFDLSNRSGSSTMDLGELVPYVDGMFTGFYDITDSDRQVIAGASYKGKLRLPNRSFAKHGYRRYALESELIAIQFDGLAITRKIYSVNDLESISTSENTLDGYYRLEKDVDAGGRTLSLVGSWTNSSSKGFIGTFEGNGHTISNVCVPSGGFFNCIGAATIRNLGLANVSGTNSVMASEVHGATIENLAVSSKNCERIFNFVGERSKIVNMLAVLENGKYTITTLGSASDAENIVQNFLVVAGKAEANSGGSGTRVPGIFFNYYQADDPAELYGLQTYNSIEEMVDELQNNGLPSGFDFGIRLDGSKVYYNDALICRFEIAVTAPATVHRGTSCTVQAQNSTFSLKQSIQGISVNRQTGVVTVAKDVPEFTEFTVVVQHKKYADASAEVTIRVTIDYKPVQTDVLLRYDLSTGKEALSFTVPQFAGTFKRIGWQGTDGFKEGVTVENGTFTLTAEAMKALGTGDGNLCIYTEEENVYYVDAVIADRFIYTYDDLAALYQAKTLAGYYMLANDIEANNANALTLIGTWTNKSNEGFVGTFNGDGHTISNLKVGSAGLFGYIGTGTVKNLGLANVSGGTSVLANEAHGMCLDNLFISSPDATYLVNYAGSSSTKNVISVLENGQQYIVTDGSVSDHNSHRNIISVVGDPQTNSGWSGTKVVGFFMNYYSFDDPCSQYGLKHYYTAEELLEALEKSNTVQAWTDSSFTYDGGALMFSGKMVLMPEIIVNGPNYAYRGKTTKLGSPNAVFSLQEAVEGITVAADGTITVAADVPEQTEFTVIAIHTAFSQITQSLKMKVTIDYNKIDLTDTMVDFDLSENVNRYRYKIPNFEGTFKALGWEGQDYVDANGIRVRNGELLITKSAMNAIGSGSGTLCVYTEEENVYLLRVTVADKIISNVEELKSISVTGNTLNGYYILDSDISCDDTSFKLIDTWSGSTTTGFVGTFDGRGHIIDGYNGGTSGLFYCFGNTAVVKNVAFTNTTGNTVLGGNENHGATFENIFVGGAAQYITKAAWDSPTYKNVIFVSDNAEAAVFYQGNTGTLTMNNVFVVGSAVHGYWGAKTNETNADLYADVDALLEAVGANGELSKWTGSSFTYTDGHLLFNNKTVCQAIVTLTGAQTIAPGKSENYASNGTITLKNAVEGVTLHGGVLTVGSTVPAETVITLVATHTKYPAVTVELEITVIRHYKQIDMTDLGSIGDLETAGEISQIRLPDGMDGNVIGISYGETKMYDDGISVSDGMLNIPEAWTAQVYNTYGFTEQDVKLYTDTDKCYTVTVAIVTKAISNQADLQSIAVDGTLNGYYVLTNDVVCDGTTLINLAGYTSTTTGGFVGVFDGRGYSVSNVNVGTRGLFYGIGAATIRDVAFINMISSNTSGAGSRALAGETHGCVLENVFVSSNAQYMFWTTWHSPTFKNVIFVSGDGANGQIFNEGSTGSLTAENVFLVGKTFCNYWGATINKTNVQTFASLDALLNAFSADGERNKWIGSMFNVADGKLYFNGKAVTE